MFDPESFEDEPLRAIRSTREIDQLAAWRARLRNMVNCAPVKVITHYCAVCNCMMDIDHDDSAELHCIVCNNYRLFIPFAWSPWRRLFESARYKTKRFCKAHRAAVKEYAVIAACVIGAAATLYVAVMLILGAESWIK